MQSAVRPIGAVEKGRKLKKPERGEGLAVRQGADSYILKRGVVGLRL